MFLQPILNACKPDCLSVQLRKDLLFLLLSCVVFPVSANQLPPVSGASYDGQQISWDALPEAVGYNIFLEFQYIDTVTSSTSYVPTQRGEYRIGGFDNEGRFSPLQVIDRDVVPTTNIVQVDTLPGEDEEPPINNEQLPPVTGVFFDGAEIFWDELPSATGYNIYLDFQYLETVVGRTSYVPNLSGEYRIAAFDNEGRFSPLQVIDADVVDTDNMVFVNLDDVFDQPTPPQNARITVYSVTAAELFWDRAPAGERVVGAEVIRDGQFLGVSPGTSFYDDTRSPGVVHSYELFHVTDTGEISEPVFINPGQFSGNPEVVAQSVLTGISEATGNNPHVKWFSTIRSFTSQNSPLTLLSSDRVTENSLTVFRNVYQCDSGVLTRDEIDSRFGTFRLSFSDCAFNGVSFFGDVSIVETDIGGYNAVYDFLVISSDEQESFIAGAVSSHISRAQNYTQLTYTEFVYLSVNPLAEFPIDDTFIQLDQEVTDSIRSDGRTSLTTQLIVAAPWTGGETMNVSTRELFSGHGPDNGHYLMGILDVLAPNGDSVVITADTGDSQTWEATINNRQGSSTVSGLWNDNNRLPCVSVTRGSEALIGCVSP